MKYKCVHYFQIDESIVDEMLGVMRAIAGVEHMTLSHDKHHLCNRQ